MFWVYILQCSDDSFYVGHSDDLQKRLYEHETGLFSTCYTFNKRPIQLVFTEQFESRENALARERQLKGWSRAKKIALINSDWDKLILLSKSYFNS
ncbi:MULTISPECIES: GIY-YIG nuclease family protein [Moraxella]|uniref:GIY-YIG domain-containing protein n=1 Tax=Moraxella lacunata TaxID=477 RepID=A0A1B8Q524_MORLA|nr:MULTISPECIES: GIY-YIG nuclease family protein [Moraxella]MBE9578923.1 GIY-YIG nuclease family protein [Moraxella sp. K1664]MBE9588267.1 GIY-YIG nuclease family protein [Moraxella sp. K1630]MBE9596425.1 GIY-YIG nuclease family protein [Moraxella sp. K2450]MDH9218773.1 GIY-YIG nuclease family protein [Moraxella lacunata]MDI4482949.1 GIY-YIG nuclease family protein [Moraxella lacunata]